MQDKESLKIQAPTGCLNNSPTWSDLKTRGMLGQLSMAKLSDLKGHLKLSTDYSKGIEMSFQLMFYVHHHESQDSMSFQDIPSWAIITPSLRDFQRNAKIHCCLKTCS